MSAVLNPAHPAPVIRGKPEKPSGTGVRLQVISEPDALRALAPQLESLAAEAAEPNPFYEHWMLIPALEAFGAGAHIRCVAVWQDGLLAAFLPMELAPRFMGMPVKVLRAWRHRNMLLCEPLIRAKATRIAANALLTSGLAPVMEFDFVPTDGPFYGALTEAAHALYLPWAVTYAFERPVLLRERDPRPKFNSNMKNNLRRNESRLRALGKLEAVRMMPGDDVEAWVQAFMQLEASGWKGRAGTAHACREPERRFMAAVCGEAFRRGQIQMTGLDLDGRPLSRHFMFTAGEGAFTYKIAYDETYAKHSPGLVGEVDNVRQFMEMPGLRFLDSNTTHEFVPGYERVWKDRRTIHRVAIGTGAAGRLAVGALPLLRVAKSALRRRR